MVPATHTIARDLFASENGMTNTVPFEPDGDLSKGAVEQETPSTPGTRPDADRLGGQLSHRESDSQIKDADSDFPEPGSSPEHSGQK
jgi:hypothetical protein